MSDNSDIQYTPEKLEPMNILHFPLITDLNDSLNINITITIQIDILLCYFTFLHEYRPK